MGEPRTGRVVHDGAELAWRVDGAADGPVLVLGNSLGTTIDLWEPQMATFSAYFTVVRFDLRGHGDSSAPPGPYSVEQLAGDVLAVADAAGAGRFSYCGISLGGMLGMWLGAHRPERIDGLVLAATAPFLEPAGWIERAATVRREGTGGLVETLVGRWFPPGYRAAQPEVVAAVARMIAGCDAEGYAGCCDAIAAMDQRPSLPQIAAAPLVVAGADDPVTPPSTGLALAGAIPKASFSVLPGAAHLVNLPDPSRFGVAVVDHLLGRPAARGTAVRRAVLGDAHVDRAAPAGSAVSAGFSDFLTRYAWGEVWSRPGLDRRTRSAVTVAMLAALGRPEELDFHLPAALRNGLTADEVGEILLQAAVYAGIPAARSAFLVAERRLGPSREADR